MASQLRVGAAVRNISPGLGVHMQGYFEDRQATDLQDDLCAKAIVVQNDDIAIAFVVCDLIGCYGRDLDVARARASELTGIPGDRILISCTHTHYGPNTLQLAHLPYEAEYTAWAMQRIGEAVKLAQNRLEPARLGHASGSCPEEVHNRRWWMKDGSVRMCPGYLHPDRVKPAGPTDPEVGIAVFLRRDDERPIAALCNYPLHYVGTPAGTVLSANYFGAFLRAWNAGWTAVVAASWPTAVAALSLTPYIPSAPPMPEPFYQVERVANVVAARAYAAWQQIRAYDPAPVLACTREAVPFERRQYSAADEAKARVDVERRGAIPPVEWAYALETLKIAELPVSRPVPVSAWRLGDLGLVGLPGEMFVEYGLQIKAGSPLARTMVVELADDFLGYCPTDAALREGGYETRLCRWAMAAAGTEGRMVSAGVRLLKQLHAVSA